jgi:hypothetical protein
MRLSGWKRIGVVVSVIWMVVGSFWFSGQITNRAASYASMRSDTCDLEKVRDQSIDCSKSFEKAYASLMRSETAGLTPIGMGAIEAFVVLVVAWLALWLALAVVRWVWAGFVRQPQVAEISSPGADDGPRRARK